MGYGAAISSLVSTGLQIYGQLSKKSPNAPLAEESSRINEAANKYILPFTDPSKWSIDVPGMAQQSINFGLANAPAINQANQSQILSMLNTAMPGWSNMFGQMQANTGQLLSGQVPSDVQQQIQRSAAFTSLMGGSAGAGTGATGAITARDLGLTSLQLQQTGFNQGQQLLSFARNSLMPQPVNPTSLLPLSDLVNATEWSKAATFSANQAAFTAKSDAAAAAVGAPQQSVVTGLASILGGLNQTMSARQPQNTGGGSTGWSSLFNMLGSMGGGGDSGPGGAFGGSGGYDTSGSLPIGASFGAGD